MAKCKFCKKEFTQFNSTISVCGYQCAIEWGKLHPKKTSIKRVNSEIKSEAKNKLKTQAQLRNPIKLHFQKWCRIRDEKEPCISCGTTEAKWDGGHYLKAEIYSGVIFDERNVNKQCSYCNQYLDGNTAAYRQGLIKKIGLDQVIALENLANETRTKKWTIEELQQIKNKYKKPNQ
jgi:hypothetical protein